MSIHYVKVFIFLVGVIFSTQTFADVMQERRIAISASIFPRLVAVDEDIFDKLDDSNNIRLGLIYIHSEDNAKIIAKRMTRKINKILGKNIVFEYINITVRPLSTYQNLSGLFLTEPVSSRQIKDIVNYSNQHHIINFSPFEGDVERGIIASIFIGAKIKPYFNLTSLRNADLNLKPALIGVSKIYE